MSDPYTIAATRIAPGATLPLCVDLDGTLIRADVLWESLVRLLKRNPACLFLLPFWLARGRANLKRQIASRIQLDPALIPYNSAFLNHLTEAKAAGRPLILVTAADLTLAKSIATHLGIFSEVLGSDGHTNLRGSAKASMLVTRFGERGFDYAGDSTVDLPVWQASRHAIVIAPPGGSLENAAARVSTVTHTFPAGPPRWRAAFKALRPHQWSKNLIIFVPLLASHKITHIPLISLSVGAFFAFCAAASSVYVVNDIIDLDSDRRHSRKHRRGFASGDLPLAWGLVMAPVLIAVSIALTVFQPLPFQCTLVGYLLLSNAYSYAAKRVALLDVFVLAALYTVRLPSKARRLEA